MSNSQEQESSTDSRDIVRPAKRRNGKHVRVVLLNQFGAVLPNI